VLDEIDQNESDVSDDVYQYANQANANEFELCKQGYQAQLSTKGNTDFNLTLRFNYFILLLILRFIYIIISRSTSVRRDRKWFMNLTNSEITASLILL
jgi:hypothetical protein